MKKCPKCHADIEENAKFCLYCMTSFEEKETIEFSKDNKRWILYLVSALLALAIIISGIIIFTKKANNSNFLDSSSNEMSGDLPDFSNSGVADDYLNGNTSGNDTENDYGYNKQGDDKAEESQVFGQSSSNASGRVSSVNKTSGGSSSGDKKNSNDGKVNNTTTQNQTGSSDETSNSISNNEGTSSKGSTSTIKNSSANSTVSNNPTTVTPVFEYITGTNENVYPAGQGMLYPLENIIVITKVGYTEPSGNYVIPETIDGKKVGAIMPSAFSNVGNNLKSVTLPDTVRTIWNDAFKGCYNLKDLYIKSNVICIETNAFPEKSKRNSSLTIHCKRDCMNFDYYYYRNIAENYDADYQEWNG